jgi:hypothetical protein
MRLCFDDNQRRAVIMRVSKNFGSRFDECRVSELFLVSVFGTDLFFEGTFGLLFC